MQNYGNFYYPQQRFTPLKIYSVSNILEANATPVENLDPIFFFNRSENVIYKKQIDGTGAAPIQIYQLAEPQHTTTSENTSANINPYEENFKALNDRLDILQKSFNDYVSKFEEKGSKK